MTPGTFAEQLVELDAAAGRVIAGRALRDAVRDAARIAHELDVELRTLGARS